MKKVIFLLVILTFSLGVGKGLYYFKDGFSPRRIHSLDYRVALNWDAEADRALSQTFHYIGRGRQCFAFATEDNQYVLKFPRTDIYKTPFWLRALPFPAYRKHLEIDHLEREQFILESFQISFRDLKEQTGLLALHLGQSDPSGKTLTLIDALGCKHRLPLDKTAFVLQYKQPILIKTFLAALEKGDREEGQRILDALIAAVVERGRKGILNRDRSFLRNYGFDGKRAYQIDVGSFFRNENLDPTATFQKSVRDSMDPVQEWLAKTDPEMLEYLNQKLRTIL